MTSDALPTSKGLDLSAEITDLELAKRAAAGDEQAAIEWVQRVSPSLLRTATLILQDRHLAEDALQEALVSALKAVHRYDGRAPLGSWLLRILINRCHSYRRSPKTRPWIHMERPETTPDPEDAAQRAAERETLRKALLKLPVVYRTVIVLHYYEDRSIEEIADILQRSVGTVKSQLHRARRRVAKLLDEGGGLE